MSRISLLPSRRNQTCGFTLVEILVVIAIVALLAAILLPVFNRVKAGGRRATCASNLRQIGVALNQYAQDTRFYPHIDPNAFGDGKRCSPWADKIFPYLKSERVFECPSSEYGAYRSDCPAPDKSDPEHPISFSGSYDLNFPQASYKRDLETGSLQTSIPVRSFMSALRWTRPSSTILVLDGDGGFVSPGYQEPPAQDADTLMSYGVDAHHEGGANVCFADGHVKWMRLNDLLKKSLWKVNGLE